MAGKLVLSRVNQVPDHAFRLYRGGRGGNSWKTATPHCNPHTVILETLHKVTRKLSLDHHKLAMLSRANQVPDSAFLLYRAGRGGIPTHTGTNCVCPKNTQVNRNLRLSQHTETAHCM